MQLCIYIEYQALGRKISTATVYMELHVYTGKNILKLCTIFHYQICYIFGHWRVVTDTLHGISCNQVQ